MPRYVFRCEKCSTEFEQPRRIADMDEPAHCPKCGGLSVRLLTTPSCIIIS